MQNDELKQIDKLPHLFDYIEGSWQFSQFSDKPLSVC